MGYPPQHPSEGSEAVSPEQLASPIIPESPFNYEDMLRRRHECSQSHTPFDQLTVDLHSNVLKPPSSNLREPDDLSSSSNLLIDSSSVSSTAPIIDQQVPSYMCSEGSSFWYPVSTEGGSSQTGNFCLPPALLSLQPQPPALSLSPSALISAHSSPSLPPITPIQQGRECSALRAEEVALPTSEGGYGNGKRRKLSEIDDNASACYTQRRSKIRSTKTSVHRERYKCPVSSRDKYI